MLETHSMEAGLKKQPIGELELRNGVNVDAWEFVHFYSNLRSCLGMPKQEGQVIIDEMCKIAKGELPIEKKKLSPITRKMILPHKLFRTDDGKDLKPLVKEALLQGFERDADGVIRAVEPWKDTQANREVLRRVHREERVVIDEIKHGLADNDDSPRWERN